MTVSKHEAREEDPTYVAFVEPDSNATLLLDGHGR